jgi:hypothetical protein
MRDWKRSKPGWLGGRSPATRVQKRGPQYPTTSHNATRFPPAAPPVSHPDLTASGKARQHWGSAAFGGPLRHSSSAHDQVQKTLLDADLQKAGRFRPRGVRGPGVSPICRGSGPRLVSAALGVGPWWGLATAGVGHGGVGHGGGGSCLGADRGAHPPRRLGQRSVRAAGGPGRLDGAQTGARGV